MADAAVRPITGRKAPRKGGARTPLQALTAGSSKEKLEAQRDLAAARLADPKTSARDFAAILKLYREIEAALDVDSGGGAPGAPAGMEASAVPDEPWDGEF